MPLVTVDGRAILDTTNAERQRRYIRRLKARAKAADENVELKRQLAAAKARIQQLENAARSRRRKRAPAGER